SRTSEPNRTGGNPLRERSAWGSFASTGWGRARSEVDNDGRRRIALCAGRNVAGFATSLDPANITRVGLGSGRASGCRRSAGTKADHLNFQNEKAWDLATGAATRHKWPELEF